MVDEVIVEVRFERSKFVYDLVRQTDGSLGIDVVRMEKAFCSSPYSYIYKGNDVKKGDKLLVNSPKSGYTIVEVSDVLPRDSRPNAHKYAQSINS